MDDRERNAVEHLNRLWDSTLDFGSVEPDGELTDAISALHAIDDAPDPDPVFVARLRKDLLIGREPATPRVPRGAQPLGLVWPSPAIVPPRPFARLVIAAIAAVLLVAALSGGGRWLAGSGPAPMIASAMASSVPDRPTAVPTMAESPLGNRAKDVSVRFYPTVVPGLDFGARGHNLGAEAR